ncbi:MAG: nucleotidyltransferase [Aridibacter famidurans]|nr:nucleotidyltransferase [Aridibacter famidurans]
MEVISDFKELLGLLNAKKVEFLIVGGYATAFHGAPRFTGDLDIYVKPEKRNAESLLEALDEFGFGSLAIEESDFERADSVVQLGVPPVRIDIMTSISGVEWREARSGAVKGDYGGVSVNFIGREDLIRNKRSVGRKQDLADVEALEAIGR